MYINAYKYTIGDIKTSDNIVFSTKLRVNNKGYNNCSKEFKAFCSVNCNLLKNSKICLLYIAGPTLSSTFSTITNTDKVQFSSNTTSNYLIGYTGPLIRTLSCSMLHMYEKQLLTSVPSCEVVIKESIDFACASGGYALARAEKLLEAKDIDYVVIVGEEIITYNTYSLFKESNIDLLLGDGFSAAIISTNPISSTDTALYSFKKFYSYNINPFHVDSIGYSNVYLGKSDYVKLHGTGTCTNSKAEEFILDNTNIPIIYKSIIGHTQGISAFIETLMLIEDNNIPSNSEIEVLASGFGGYYIGYKVNKG